VAVTEQLRGSDNPEVFRPAEAEIARGNKRDAAGGYRMLRLVADKDVGVVVRGETVVINLDTKADALQQLKRV
jgi:hypothetical protein